ncbi:hypothetical protein H2200_010115 [Cladophialophora chaetospira]|uniref:Heterokaryon incompatibility domain-containing protein n=1 Tax=Cladophialophora chaetospira TaxID=386627 RepID=A0AA38X2D2_9EURO|nr:hypothetical protein H2200_010115 [Cladophialophora chaetospira]
MASHNPAFRGSTSTSLIPAVPKPSSENAGTQIRTVHFARCRCSAFNSRRLVVSESILVYQSLEGPFKFESIEEFYETHVAVTFQIVSLDTPNTSAISYAWGDFRRRPVIIGHEHGDPTKTISLNLGTEWKTPDLLFRLIEICESGQTLWIDQLSMPSKDDEVRAWLAKVPDIYRSLQVIIIMPGSLCRCVAEDVIWKDWCYAAVNPCGYFFRVWPMQEIIYATTARVVFTSDTRAECWHIEKNMDDVMGMIRKMSPYFLHLAYDEHKKGRKLFSVLESIIHFKEIYGDTLSCVVLAFPEPGNVTATPNHATVLDFLLGKQLGDISKNQRLDQGDSRARYPTTQNGKGSQKYHGSPNRHAEQEMMNFSANMTMAGVTYRKATDFKDYVLSMWVHLAGYNIPATYRTLSLSALLEDAVEQMQKKYSLTLPSLAPASLFSAQLDNIFWSPKLLLDGTDPSSTHNIYGTLGNLGQRPCFSGWLPIRFRDNLATTSRSVYSYTDYFAKSDHNQIITMFGKTMNNILRYNERLIARHYYNFSPHARERAEAMMRPEAVKWQAAPEILECAFTSALRQSVYKTDMRKWDGMPDVDHHKIIYDLTCEALGLNPRICRRTGLELMLAPEDPPMIGLILNSERQNELFRPYKVGRGVITVTLDDSPNNERRMGWGLLNVARWEGQTGGARDGLPCYRAVGFWLPAEKVAPGDVDAWVLAIDREKPKFSTRGVQAWCR